MKKMQANNPVVCMGCTAETFIDSCETVKLAQDHKSSGFYYVKTTCMPSA